MNKLYTEGKRVKTFYFFLIFLLCCCTQLSAQGTFMLADENKTYDLNKNAYYYIDQSESLSPDSLVWGRACKKFKPLNKLTIEGLKGVKSVWVKIVVNNISDHDIESSLLWGYSSKIDIYVANVSKITQVYHTGYLCAKPERECNPMFSFTNQILFRSNPSETVVLVHYQNEKRIFIQPFICPLKNRLLDSSEQNMWMGLFFGILLIMMIYHLLIYQSLRDKAYLYYILYMAFAMLMFLRTKGYLNPLLPSDSEFWNFALMTITDNMVTASYMLFARKFIDLKKLSPKSDRLVLWLVRVRVLIVLLTFTYFCFSENITSTINTLNITILIELIIFFFAVKCLFHRSDIVVKYFLVGSAWVLGFGFYAVFMILFNKITYLSGSIAIEVGVVGQILIFALGFGQKLKITEAEKRISQEKLIVQLKENDLLQTKVNRELEQKVQERTLEIKQQKEEIETMLDDMKVSNQIIQKKNNQITDSIQYAKRIQDAFLPMEDELKDYFSSYFIYYKAREIVSGDFYWMKKLDNRFLFAVADSTGHGVPGALMSMLGNAALNEVSGTSTPVSTNEMLDKLRHVVKSALKQTGENQEAKDGFDLIICALDIENRALEFSAANRSLYIIRNKELLEFKGDRQPIGVYVHEKPFTSQRIELQDNDCIYLFTDGYSSQFGGEKGETFKTNRLKDLLLRIHLLPMDQQKDALSDQLKAWQGVRDQVDDITVWGLRV